MHFDRIWILAERKAPLQIFKYIKIHACRANVLPHNLKDRVRLKVNII